MSQPQRHPSLFPASTAQARGDAPGLLTVSELTRMVKRALDAAMPRLLNVVGQISNFKLHSSGHVYFTLKDAASELSCVMWRSAASTMKFKPADGMEVIASGSIDVFEKSGRYQFYAQRLEPRGIGALELAFRQLKDKLEKEGLFDAARKRPLPAFPSRIALVTSPTGAAIRDMLRTLARRFPCVEVLLIPVRVQGEGAAREIAEAIGRINATIEAAGGVDVLIVGRGGGSLEDLWAFNEEIVARAIHASRIPVVSAVGHEVDVTIVDLVADVRAATPTAAAEIVVPVLTEVLEDLAARRRRLTRAVCARCELDVRGLRNLAQRATFREPLRPIRLREQMLDEHAAGMLRLLAARLAGLRRRIDRADLLVQRIAPHAYLAAGLTRLHTVSGRLRLAWARRASLLERAVDRTEHRLDRRDPRALMGQAHQHVEHVSLRLRRATAHQLQRCGDRLAAGEQLLGALSYKSVLRRGYSITRLKKGRAVVRSVTQLADADRLLTELVDGEVESRVADARQGELFDA